MANSRTFLINASTRHAIYINRYSGSQLKEMLPYLQRIKKRLAGELSQGDLTEFSRKRLQKTYNEIESMMLDIYTRMGKKLESNTKAFASYEAQFSKRMMEKATRVEWDIPAMNQVHAAVFSEPVVTLGVKGIDVGEVLDEFGKTKSKQLLTLIQDGVILGRSNPEIIKDFAAVIDSNVAKDLQAVVRTITSHASSVSRNEVLKANEDIVDRYQWVSTLDSRTTETCMALDGQIFYIGKGPMPPAHFNCRSTTIPIVKKEYNIQGLVDSERPAVGEDGPEQGVSATMNYGDWLKTQPNAFQDEVLGQTKAQLFRDGGLSLDRFVDANYKPLTLEQLRELEPSAFKKAGLY